MLRTANIDSDSKFPCRKHSGNGSDVNEHVKGRYVLQLMNE